MFTQQESESETAAGEAGAPEKTTFEVESKKTPSAAKERHAEVVRETRKLMIAWIFILTINIMTHFMRMAVAMLYCIKRFEVSELLVGLMASTHMLVLSVANSYTCYSIDNYSFESLMIVRFSLLTLATLGEYLADSFAMFALIYCVASLSIVWFGVQAAYLIQTLPPMDAKELTSMGILYNQMGVVVGLSLGGTIGGFISLRSVFLLSFIIAVISLIWIVFYLRGKEQRIKDVQCSEIAEMYQDYPESFTDHNQMFPVPFASQIQPLNFQKNDDDDKEEENEPMLAAKQKAQGSLDLCSVSALPFWVLTFRNSLKNGVLGEFIGWWNIYAHQVFDANVSQSSGQCVISIIAGIIVGGICIANIKHQTLDFDVLLKWNTIVCVLTGLTITLLFLALFPFLRFPDFWWAMPLINICFGMTIGFPNTLQVFESPAQKVGKVFAAYIAVNSAVPAVQHVIIGSLWVLGGHQWMFRWFGMMHFVCAIIVIAYYLIRKDNPPMRGTRISQFQLK